jgi:hypothetical protein
MKMAIPKTIATAFMLTTATIPSAAEAREAQNAIAIVLPLVGIDSVSSIQSNSAIQIDLNYQRVLGNHWVFSFLPRFFYGWGGKGSWVSIYSWVEGDWHPWDDGLGGFFIGPAIQFPLLNPFSPYNYFDVGGAIGYQLLLPSGFVLDFVARLLLGAGTAGGLATGGISIDAIEVGFGYQF